MEHLPTVRIENVCKDYGQSSNSENALVVHALRSVSLSIERGAFSAMVGPSGSGKSTLLNLIGGLDRPTRGEIFVENRPLSPMSNAELSILRRDRIGFVFQNYNLIPVLTAAENAEYVLLLQGVPPAERRERIYNLLKVVGLAGMEDRFPRELSGGQQQRVAIARAIACEPALVLADEPTANVDSKTAESLLDLMEKLNQEKNITFLFSTHDAHVMKRAKTLLVLKDGQIGFQGPSKDFRPDML